MIDPQVALDKLSSFGTAYELADYFRGEGIQGVRAAHDQCPIATWMTEMIGMRTSVATHIVVYGHYDVPTPEVLMEFMRLFDRGDFPDLKRQ